MHIIHALILLTEASNDNRILWKDFGWDFKLVFTSVQLENKAISTENLRNNQQKGQFPNSKPRDLVRNFLVGFVSAFAKCLWRCGIRNYVKHFSINMKLDEPSSSSSLVFVDFM